MSVQTNYPCRIAFFIVRDKDGNQNVGAMPCKDKCKKENIKLASAQVFLMDGRKTATLGVKEVASEEEMKAIMIDYAHFWGTVNGTIQLQEAD